MTATHFSAVRGSRGPSLDDTLQQNGGAYNLTGRTVSLRIQHGATGEVVEFSLSIDPDPTTGRVFIDWAEGDLDIREGVWWGQYLVSVPGGGVEIWPTSTTTDPCDSLMGWHGLKFEICPAIPAP